MMEESSKTQEITRREVKQEEEEAAMVMFLFTWFLMKVVQSKNGFHFIVKMCNVEHLHIYSFNCVKL